MWRKATGLAKAVYIATSSYPKEEKFGLVSQMRRAAISIPSNLAEGHARSGSAEFKHFISVAMGSVAELETQVILSMDFVYLSENTEGFLLNQLDEVGKMLRGLNKSLSIRREG
ncbi:MAG TPA: four helix bundle protein [Pyrinomonadaceae bacterium]|nr:four helix bundle protein [Pyrinomonadaceae bacterium]